jgi:hypothetical protein
LALMLSRINREIICCRFADFLSYFQRLTEFESESYIAFVNAQNLLLLVVAYIVY